LGSVSMIVDWARHSLDVDATSIISNGSDR